MAQPTNTFDSYDMVGIREDLSDVIFEIDNDQTPFMAAIGKTTASNTFHEWQTDSLRAAAANAHIEGDDTVAVARTATVRLGNYTQIFKDAITIPGTDTGLNKAGRGKEMAYQTKQAMTTLKMDMELAFFANNARVAGNSTTARELAGVPAWITSNIANAGTGAADPTGDGTDARTDGTQTAFTQADFDAVMQSIWTETGRSNVRKVFLSPFQMNVALGFTGNNNQRNDVKKGEIANTLDVYMTPWGTVEWQPSIQVRSRDVHIIDPEFWGVATLAGRALKSEALAKTGDSEKRQLVSELTLCAKNEKASGLIVDCSTS